MLALAVPAWACFTFDGQLTITGDQAGSVNHVEEAVWDTFHSTCDRDTNAVIVSRTFTVQLSPDANSTAITGVYGCEQTSSDSMPGSNLLPDGTYKALVKKGTSAASACYANQDSSVGSVRAMLTIAGGAGASAAVRSSNISGAAGTYQVCVQKRNAADNGYDGYGIASEFTRL